MAQLNKPTIRNPELVEAMAEFKAHMSPENEAAMLDILQNAQFIAPIQLVQPLDEVQADEEGHKSVNARLLVVENNKKERVFPVFTDWIEVLKWKKDDDSPDPDTMVVTFDQYCNLVLNGRDHIEGIVINPGEASLYVRREKMAQIKGVELPQSNASSTPVQGGGINMPVSKLLKADNIQNPDLVSALETFKADPSQENQQQVTNLLRQAKYVLPARVHDMPEKIEPGEKIQAKAEFLMLNRGEDKFLPLFTSLDELEKWPNAPACAGMPLPFEQVLKIVNNPKDSSSGIVVNPFTTGLTLTKQQVQQIAPQIRFMPSQVVPLDMLSQLKEYLSTDENVDAAYFSAIQLNGMDGFLIAIDSPLGSPKATAEAVMAIVKKFGTCVVAPVKSPLGEKAIEGKAPFYEA